MDILTALRQGKLREARELILSASPEDLQFHDAEWVSYTINKYPKLFIEIFSTYSSWEPFEFKLIRINSGSGCYRSECSRYRKSDHYKSVVCFEFLVADPRSLPFRRWIVSNVYIDGYRFNYITAKYPELYQYLTDEKLLHIWSKIPSDLIPSDKIYSDLILKYLRQKPGVVKELSNKIINESYRFRHCYGPKYCEPTCEAIFKLEEVVIDVELINRLDYISFYRAIIASGRLGTCAGRSSENPVIEMIWEKIKDEDPSNYRGFILFYGYRFNKIDTRYIRSRYIPKLFTRPWYDSSYPNYNKQVFRRYILLREVVIKDIADYIINQLL